MHTPHILLDSQDSLLYGKIEYQHPSGSMKHRSIPAFIENIVKSGIVSAGQSIAIRSAGAAAITTAWACAKFNIPSIAVLPKFAPNYFVNSLTWLGGQVFRLDNNLAMQKMQELDNDPNIYVFEQADEPQLIEHYRVVAREILEDKPDTQAIIVGMGTGLSIMGIVKEIQAQKSNCAVYGVEPAEAAIATGAKWAPHKIPGLAPPRSRPLLDLEKLSGIINIPSATAWSIAKRVAKQQGLIIGPSSGATIAAALELRKKDLQGPVTAICACSMHEYFDLSLDY